MTPGEELIPAGEAAQIEKLVALNLALLDTRERPVRRGQHPKHHGLVRGEFVVEKNLPPELRHGLFARERSFPCLVRFSNSGASDDRKRDAHGMAIKLFDVRGEKLVGVSDTHDFIMFDHPVFFIRNNADYIALFQAALEARRSILPKLAFFVPRILSELALVYLKFLRKRPHELAIIRQVMSKRPDSPLSTEYWSTTPYRLGPHVVRWTARPERFRRSFRSVNAPHKLRHAMVEQLGAEEATFAFMAQVQTDPERMPIEDPTLPWDETKSPQHKLATIRIPKQRFDTPALMKFCEDMSFNVWRCLPEHRPLGAINRARRAVYQAVSGRRRELNGAPTTEPTMQEYEALQAKA